MAKKVPKPRIGDIVETLDLEKINGRVVGFQTTKKVRVRWTDKTGKIYIAIENIKDLALVSRPKQFRKLKKVI